MFGLGPRELVIISILLGIIILAILAFLIPVFIYRIRYEVIKIRNMMEELIELVKSEKLKGDMVKDKELRRDIFEGIDLDSH